MKKAEYSFNDNWHGDTHYFDKLCNAIREARKEMGNIMIYGPKGINNDYGFIQSVNGKNYYP
jgi:hypothetical protein